MPELGRFARELRARFWKPTVEDEVRAELAHHLEMLEQDLVARGLDPAAARRAARERFGDPGRIGAECRDEGERRDREAWRARWIGEWRQDVGYALRQLRANPRFALVAVVTLGVALGASTTIFGIANAVLLRPLPFHEPSRLVLVDELNGRGDAWAISEPNFLDVKARARTLDGLAAMKSLPISIVGDGAPERLRGVAATSDLFGVLGAAPQLGRVYSVDEDTPRSGVRVAILSDALWRRRFGADPRIVGRTIELDGTRHRVVGVMRPGFDFPGKTDVWVPLAVDPSEKRGDRRLQGVGRLAPGVIMEQARQEIAAIARQLAAEHPRDNSSWTARVHPFEELYVTPQLTARVTTLLVAVALLVLMACVNVASLLLARAGVRAREMAVRAALGAGRGRIVRQLLTESLVLAVLGGALGTGLAAMATPIIRGTGSAAVPLLATMELDWRVLGFALAACMATGIVFGLAPAYGLARTDAARGGDVGGGAHALLRGGARVARGGRTRGALVVCSIAMATTMLVSAGLVGASFVRLMRTDPGFSSSHVLAASIVLPDAGYDFDRSARFFEELTPRLAAIPGVRAAGAVNLAPFSGGNTAMDFVPGANAPADPRNFRSAHWRAVTPGYFAALGIPLVRGRLLDGSDRMDAPNAMVVNESMARLGWPDGDPVGRQVTLGNGWTMTVVGVVGDTRQLSMDSLPAPTMYFAHAQFPWQAMWLAIRTAGDPMAVLPAVRREVAALDPSLPLARVQTLDRLVRDVTAEPRLTTLVLGIFAAAALVLVAVGLYGLVSYTVAQRTREIGVRLALGATPSRIARTVLTRGLALAALGVAVGVGLAHGASGLLRTLLFETHPTDPATYVGVTILLLAIAAVASLAPARRAARLDPVQTLRQE